MTKIENDLWAIIPRYHLVLQWLLVLFLSHIPPAYASTCLLHHADKAECPLHQPTLSCLRKSFGLRHISEEERDLISYTSDVYPALGEG